VGAVANLVAVRASSLADVLAGAGDGRVVVHRGRLVSRTTVHRETAVELLPAAESRPA
jgi:cytosine deaminase